MVELFRCLLHVPKLPLLLLVLSDGLQCSPTRYSFSAFLGGALAAFLGCLFHSPCLWIYPMVQFSISLAVAAPCMFVRSSVHALLLLLLLLVVPDAEAEEARQEIEDATQTNLVNLRRTIYLTIMSSLDFEEAGHKLLKIQMKGQEPEIPIMIIECCSNERTYNRYYGLLAARFCMVGKEYQVGAGGKGWGKGEGGGLLGGWGRGGGGQG